MDRYHIPLSDREVALVSRIDLRTRHDRHEQGRAAFLANQEPILELLRSLSHRDAVPAHRLSYWNDPHLNPGRVKASRKQDFERNGCVGDEVYTHPHFVKHLRYMLFGADLPDGVIVAFEKTGRGSALGVQHRRNRAWEGGEGARP